MIGWGLWFFIGAYAIWAVTALSVALTPLDRSPFTWRKLEK